MTSLSVSFSAARPLAVSGPVGEDGIQAGDDGARRFRALVEARRLGIRLERLHGIEPHDAEDFAADEGKNRKKRHDEGDRRGITQPVGAGEEIADKLIRPQPEGKREQDTQRTERELTEREAAFPRRRDRQRIGIDSSGARNGSSSSGVSEISASKLRGARFCVADGRVVSSVSA